MSCQIRQNHTSCASFPGQVAISVEARTWLKAKPLKLWHFQSCPNLQIQAFCIPNNACSCGWTSTDIWFPACTSSQVDNYSNLGTASIFMIATGEATATFHDAKEVCLLRDYISVLLLAPLTTKSTNQLHKRAKMSFTEIVTEPCKPVMYRFSSYSSMN